MGVRGAHVTVGRRGVTRTVGLPGTGLFYTSRSGHHTGLHTHAENPAQPAHGAGAAAVVAVLVMAWILYASLK